VHPGRREALKRFYEKGKGATLGDIARILELASRLGRLASGLATDKTEITGEGGGPVLVEFELPCGRSTEPSLTWKQQVAR